MSKYGKKEKAIIALAYLHGCGWIFIMLALICICPMGTLWFISAGFLSNAIWTFVGYRRRWKHIFCSFQAAHRLSMTPKNIRWGWVKKFDAYVMPIIELVVGLAFLCMAILETLGILTM